MPLGAFTTTKIHFLVLLIFTIDFYLIAEVPFHILLIYYYIYIYMNTVYASFILSS